MLLDVNNVYVNSINHKYDAKAFINGLPSDKIVYGHIAGHYDEAEDLKVDTTGLMSLSQFGRCWSMLTLLTAYFQLC